MKNFRGKRERLKTHETLFVLRKILYEKTNYYFISQHTTASLIGIAADHFDPLSQ